MTFRTDEHRTDTTRADARPLTVAERYARSVRASGDRWKNTGDAAPALGVRHDATTDHASDAPDTADRVRIDVASIPKVGDLYARSVEASRNRWRNTGDKPERGGR